jgi:hypothetical protein
LSGDGVVDRTIREARLMADGEVSEDKVIRTNAWAARHLVDLDAEDNRDPEAEGFPGAGAVAFYLWGIDALDPEPAMDWFARKSEQIQAEERSAFVVGEPRGATIDPMTTVVETRRITVNEFELRDLGEGDGMAFTGYAAVFNSESETLDDDAAMLIESVVQKLRADTTIGDEAKASLDMKRKQLDLLFSRV